MSSDLLQGVNITEREMLLFCWALRRGLTGRPLTQDHCVFGQAKSDSLRMFSESLSKIPKLAVTLRTGSRQGSWKTEGEPEAESPLTGTVSCCCQFSCWTVAVSVLARTVSSGKKKSDVYAVDWGSPPPAAVPVPLSIDIPRWYKQWLFGFRSNTSCSKSECGAKCVQLNPYYFIFVLRRWLRFTSV